MLAAWYVALVGIVSLAQIVQCEPTFQCQDVLSLGRPVIQKHETPGAAVVL